ncbi:AAA family ATPase [Streptomyces sp. SCA3-4]|uniref:adenylate/guanylate cyclase domain-containing protein n=1 Tax=Streptomyces sichuanensis TaxID=2871810 RepID=UPI001CE25F3B|nr:adenylate/guanylate cyclase domain-containing protein [Streptomyces sichuanensis]MCA6091837.1 AAA family ATPase [Streptomyces sichuanensis]
MQCTGCGTALPGGARFCPACGNPSPPGDHAPAAPAETRKVVTVVFCDLVGSTALSGRLDPEILRHVTLRYFTLMRQRIEEYGGTVEKFIGDAVMAVFGVPTLHEDDARRAAAAALGMLDALDGYNQELAATYGVRLDVRIGVNTGEVVATTDASVRQALVSGEVVNVAARLEQHAPAGSVLIGAATREAAGGSVVVEPTGPLRLKGKDGETTAYRLLAVRPDDPELVRRFDVPFIGREAELAALRGITDRVAREAAARVALISGEAGIGKTRLVRQWLGGPGGGPDARHGSGRCHPFRHRGSLSPLADALRQLLDRPDVRRTVTSSPEAAPALPVLDRGLLADGMPAPSLGDACAAVVRVLRAAARDGTRVLVLDDCQWADPALPDVVDRIAAALSDSPVLFVCAGRPELLEKRWGGPGESPDRVVVPPLTPHQSTLLAARLGASAPVDPGAAGRAVERAEGNPFVLEQLLAVIAENGAGARLPLTVHALLTARIDALPRATRGTLDRAAVAGRDFDAATLAELAARSDDPAAVVPEALEALTRRRLVEPLPGRAGAHRFTSALVHEVTYGAVPKLVRSATHELLARVLEERGAGDAVTGGHLERAHRLRAGLGLSDEHAEAVRRSAARRLTAAGDTALARADLSWAADLLRRATELARPEEEPWAVGAERLGEALALLGRTAEAADLLRRALRAAERARDDRTAAHARMQLAALEPGTDMAAAAAAAREAMPVFRARTDDLGLARAHLRLAQERQVLGLHGTARDLLAVSLRHAERAGAERERAMALGATGVSLWLGPEPAEQGIAQCSALLAGQGPDRGSVRLTLNCPLAVLLALRCRFDEARACLDTARGLARDLGYAESELFLPIFAAEVEALAGRYEAAERLLRRAVGACRRAGDSALLARASRALARVLLERGRPDEARRFAEGTGPAPAPSEAADLAGIRARLAAGGDREAALSAARRAEAEARRTDSPVVRAVAALDLAETHLLLSAPDRAARAARVARRHFTAKGHLPGVGVVRELLREGRPA